MLKYRDLFCKTEIHSTVIWHIAAMCPIIFDRFWWIYMFAPYNGINNCFMILEIHQYPCCQIRIDMKFRLHLICCLELKPYFIPPLQQYNVFYQNVTNMACVHEKETFMNQDVIRKINHIFFWGRMVGKYSCKPKIDNCHVNIGQ